MIEGVDVRQTVADVIISTNFLKYKDRALIKRERRRGERTLPWATPVLKVILALSMSVWGSLTVVYSYKDFRRSMSDIL